MHIYIYVCVAYMWFWWCVSFWLRPPHGPSAMPPRQTLCVSMLVIFLSFTVLNYRIHIDGYALMELFIHLAGAKKHCCQVFFLGHSPTPVCCIKSPSAPSTGGNHSIDGFDGKSAGKLVFFLACEIFPQLLPSTNSVDHCLENAYLCVFREYELYDVQYIDYNSCIQFYIFYIVFLASESLSLQSHHSK